MIGTIFEGEPEIGAQERRAKLGDKFFPRVTFIAKALTPEIAVKPRFMPRPVDVMPISA